MFKKGHRPWFEAWGESQAQNHLLKWLLLLLCVILCCACAGLTVLSLRRPVVISLSEKSTEVTEDQPPGLRPSDWRHPA